MNLGHWLPLPWAISFVLNMLFWAVFYLGAAILTIKLAFWRYGRERQRFARADLDDIDRMSGEQFESYLEVLFERLGYQAEATPRYDKGADLLLTKDGIRTAVQAKCWKGPVGVEAVRAVVAAMRPYHCTRGMVVSNSTFTRTARQAARDNGIDLWDRTTLATVLLTVNHPGRSLPVPGVVAWLFSEPREALASPLPLVHYEPNYTCATCGRQLSKGVRDYCLDKPDRFGGKVYCMDHQRQFPPFANVAMIAAGRERGNGSGDETLRSAD